MSEACKFENDLDSCQATPIRRCSYCGVHQGNACGRVGAERSIVAAYRFGNLVPELHDEARRLIALTGAQPAPAAPSGYKPHVGDAFCNGDLCAAPAAQPADSAMEVLRELVDLDRRLFSVTEKTPSDAEVDAAWDRARALTAASKERSKT
jgi:hypothetical protein